MKRQYTLPSCSLILEGLGTDTTQQMSILANVECRFMGIETPLNGGLEFFTALVDAVSHYAQGLLSNLPRATPVEKLVRLEPDGGQHRLTVAARPEVDPALTEPTALTLSTVQMFDLTDAVDQFLADGQTLPEVSMQVRSRPRREVKSTEPVADRVVPPLLGIGALAAAAAGLFMLPIPEVPEFDPESIPRSTQPGLTAPNAGLDATPEGLGEDAEVSAATVGSDTDAEDSATDLATGEVVSADDAATDSPAALDLSAADLALLQTQLEDQIADGLPADATFETPLLYEVSVAEDGAIVDYRAVNQAALTEAEATPLPALTYEPVEGAETPVSAPFSVRFDADGGLTVAPWSDAVIDELESGVESETDEDLSE
ncbi:MAG: DUF4335 domain-containing protein [Cyanobacteria bacterium P01_A01_bin.105]